MYKVEEKQRFFDKCREVAAEGAVLLKNEDHLLPLDGGKVSVFGRIQIDYYRSGTGSGGAVHVARKINLIDGLRAQENLEVNEELAAVYEAWVKENPFDDGGGGWAAEPWFQKEMPLTEEIVRKARAFSDKAVVVIGRTAGEDVDNINAPGGYLLTEEEKRRLSNFPVGQGLFFAGQNHVHIQIIASETEEGLITTNPNANRGQ